MAVREEGNVHDIEQPKKMIPFVTGDCPSGQNVSELASGVDVLMWILGSRLIL